MLRTCLRADHHCGNNCGFDRGCQCGVTTVKVYDTNGNLLVVYVLRLPARIRAE
jgi:hypothetical protein